MIDDCVFLFSLAARSPNACGDCRIISRSCSCYRARTVATVNKVSGLGESSRLYVNTCSRLTSDNTAVCRL